MIGDLLGPSTMHTGFVLLHVPFIVQTKTKSEIYITIINHIYYINIFVHFVVFLTKKMFCLAFLEKHKSMVLVIFV